MTDTSPLDICVDSYPPGEMFDPRQRPDPVNLRSTNPNELALAKFKMWQAGDRKTGEPGQLLRISFLDGDAALWEEIESYAREWLQFANLRFEFGRFAEAEIRITTINRDGYWSKVGTAAVKTEREKPTMGLGGPACNLALEPDKVKRRRAVLHEFGHAIGCVHEQARPNAEIPWSEPKVLAYYQRTLGWPREVTRANIFERYKPEEHIESEHYDPTSIMQYPVSRELTRGGFEIPWNNELSETDKEFIKRAYP